MQSNLIKQRAEAIGHLNQIIMTQSLLAEADFNLDKFMQLVVEQVENLTLATGVVVELIEGEDMVYRATTGTMSEHVGMHLPRKNSISGLCVATREVLRSDDTEFDSRVNVVACRKVKARSLVVSPLFYKDEAVGVLKIISAKPSGFNENDVHTLQLMAGLIGSALGNQIFHNTTARILEEKILAYNQLKEAQDKLEHMAHYDYLTNLCNRGFFIKQFQQIVATTKRVNTLYALLFLDIDHFKTVNDTHGHAIGDALLKTFAARLQFCIRDSDIVSRFGGDEFVILLNGISAKIDATVIAKKIINKIQEPFTLNQLILNITTSIGIAFFTDNQVDIETLLGQADHALYVAKQAGRNTCAVADDNENVNLDQSIKI